MYVIECDNFIATFQEGVKNANRDWWSGEGWRIGSSGLEESAGWEEAVGVTEV